MLRGSGINEIEPGSDYTHPLKIFTNSLELVPKEYRSV